MAGIPVCFESMPTELIDLHSLLQTCTDLQYKLTDLLSILGHAIRIQWLLQFQYCYFNHLMSPGVGGGGGGEEYFSISP